MRLGAGPNWLRRNGDVLFRLLILALAGLWVLFPPSPAARGAGEGTSAARVVEAVR